MLFSFKPFEWSLSIAFPDPFLSSATESFLLNSLPKLILWAIWVTIMVSTITYSLISPKSQLSDSVSFMSFSAVFLVSSSLPNISTPWLHGYIELKMLQDKLIIFQSKPVLPLIFPSPVNDNTAHSISIERSSTVVKNLGSENVQTECARTWSPWITTYMVTLANYLTFQNFSFSHLW